MAEPTQQHGKDGEVQVDVLSKEKNITEQNETVVKEGSSQLKPSPETTTPASPTHSSNIHTTRLPHEPVPFTALRQLPPIDPGIASMFSPANPSTYFRITRKHWKLPAQPSEVEIEIKFYIAWEPELLAPCEARLRLQIAIHDLFLYLPRNFTIGGEWKERAHVTVEELEYFKANNNAAEVMAKHARNIA